MTVGIQMCSMHRIDIDNSSTELISIDHSSEDLQKYLNDLLREIVDRQSNRKFSFKRDTLEFYISLEQAIKALEDEALTQKNFCSQLAQRLLEAEKASDERMARIRPGHVKRGSLLQFLFEEADTKYYLCVKVEHAAFIDEDDLIKRIGMPELNKSYKACLVTYNSDNTPGPILVYDTNSVISKYWWDDFLELKENWDDTYNTKRASDAVMRKLNRYKDDHPEDYTRLRNAVIVSFRRDGAMDYNDFVDTVISSYQAESQEFQEEIPNIVEQLKKFPESKKFDTQFRLVPSAVGYRRRKLNLSSEIEISYNDDIQEIDNKIWATRWDDGKEVVVIHSPEGYKRFKKKNI